MQPHEGPDRGDPAGPCPQAPVPPGLRSGPTAPWPDAEAVKCLPAGDNFTAGPSEEGLLGEALKKGAGGRLRFAARGGGVWLSFEHCPRLSPAQPPEQLPLAPAPP